MTVVWQVLSAGSVRALRELRACGLADRQHGRVANLAFDGDGVETLVDAVNTTNQL